MMGLYFEELATGQNYALGNYQFTDENIERFTRNFAPVPFHLEESAAAAGLFGKKSAVGFHICSAWMNCFISTNQREREGKDSLPEPGAGLGLQDIRWFKPVFAGDVVTYSTAITAMRNLKSKPQWGLIEQVNEGHRGSEKIVQFNSKMLVQTRSGSRSGSRSG